MSHDTPPNTERLLDLLADRALMGLDPAEAMELQRLLESEPGIDGASMDRAAAALDLALHGAGDEPLPASLRAKLEAGAAAHARGVGPVSSGIAAGSERAVIGRVGWTPWVLAAACALLAVIAWMQPLPKPTAEGPALSAAEAFEAFVGAQAPADLVRVAWQSFPDDPAVDEMTSGEVVWSDALQRGYMVFDGLAVNDPTQEQYQLWIFDAARDDRYPVDGGVFDIARGERTIVPISAKIRVNQAAAFAVTVEKPGGVVVSGRERIVTLAPVSGS